MSDVQTIELRCSKTSDGKYNARTFINGKEVKGKEFIVNRSDEFAVILLFRRVKKQYPKDELHIKGLDKPSEEKILHSE